MWRFPETGAYSTRDSERWNQIQHRRNGLRSQGQRLALAGFLGSLPPLSHCLQLMSIIISKNIHRDFGREDRRGFSPVDLVVLARVYWKPRILRVAESLLFFDQYGHKCAVIF